VSKPSIVLVQRFTYRGNNEEWTNEYHFNESPPSTPADWKTLADALAAKVKTINPIGCKIVRAYCYADSDDDSVATIDYTALAAEVDGTFSTSGLQPGPGDSAAWIRWSTTKRNSKGKTVYLRKYYHPAISVSGAPDSISGSWRTPAIALGKSLSGEAAPITGFTMCGHDGTAAGEVAVSSYATTRTLKRRGKRPPS
jgi:hypothetical protein